MALHLTRQLNGSVRKDRDLRRICASCSGVSAGEAEECDSVDCPVGLLLSVWLVMRLLTVVLTCSAQILFDRIATRHELVGQAHVHKSLDALALGEEGAELLSD